MIRSLFRSDLLLTPPVPRAPRWLRRAAVATSACFGWMTLLAVPAQALAHPAPASRPGIRVLSGSQMRQMVGAQLGPPLHGTSYNTASGGTYPWEGNAGGLNTGNGNKLTHLPLVGWNQRGGLPVAFTLAHNSQGVHNSELGQKWTFSYDIYLAASTGGSGGLAPPGSLDVHWGDDLAYQFTLLSSVFTAPTGIYDTLIKNVDNTYTLTTKNQVKYHFNTSLYCDSISDENGNAVTINHNAGNYVTSIVDATSRAITLSYDSSSRISTITDPLSRVWTLGYDTSNNLTQIKQPLLAGQTIGSNYTYAFGYDANHNIASLTSPGGRAWTASYDSTDNSLSWEQDGAGNRTTYTYTATSTTITDANSHTTVHNYGSDRLSSVTDNLSHSETNTYDASNNKTNVQDQRGYNWIYTFDARGNTLTAKDPLLNVTTFTYSSHNKPLTCTLPTGEQTVNGYDASDNLTSVTQKDSLGTTQATETFTVGTTGLRTDSYDANAHHYQYGHDANGNLSSLTTPNSHVTAWAYDGLGFVTSRTDALLRATTYTPDNWERPVTVTYPDTSAKTLQYDADGNVTQFVDGTGTTTRAYDNDNRLTNESKGGVTVVSHAYDAVGKKGLLVSTTDANSRVLTYSYDSLNRLYTVGETAGTTTYGYDNASHETSVSNPNGTTVAKSYDTASKLIGVVNANSSATTLSSFSYGYDTDGRRHTCTEASGDVVTYGYDWGSRLTSESRTGTNAYSLSYTLDGVGNRTSQTKGAATTSFTLNSDDELTATTSSTGGFVNTYGYNANGEQTSRTLSGTAYTTAFDYDGQISSITQGSAVVSFTYDGTGRRLSRTAGGTTTNFLYDGGQVLLEKQGSATTATYTYGNTLVRKDSEYPLFDGLGSERTVTNGSQTVVGTLTQDGFGNTVTSTGSSANPYMFAATSGYRNDGDAGLTHVGARYYDAQVGRFISRDTFLDQKPYLYCQHDPVNHLDPSGHFIDAIIGVIAYHYGFTNDDWRQIADGIDKIGSAEVGLGGLPILITKPIKLIGIDPFVGVLPADVLGHTGIAGMPGITGAATKGGIFGAVIGGLTIGGLAAKFLAWGIHLFTE